jgi:hypothetical protein
MFEWNINDPINDENEEEPEDEEGGAEEPPGYVIAAAPNDGGLPVDDNAILPEEQQFMFVDGELDEEQHDEDPPNLGEDGEPEYIGHGNDDEGVAPLLLVADYDDDETTQDGMANVEERRPDSEQDDGPRYNLRTNRTRDYSHRFDHQEREQRNMNTALLQCHDGTNQEAQLLQYSLRNWKSHPTTAQQNVFGYMMNQMTATAGIRKHGQAAIDALLQEFAQLDDKDVFQAVDASKLSPAQRQAALRIVNLIKEKRSGILKGRTCADGRPQRALYSKEETASPTISTDALMLSLLIDANEKRDVATADVVGAYLHAYMPDFVLIKLTGETVELMCQVNPKYRAFVVVENGKPVLYLQLLKALYGCVKSALLWYDLFTETLKERGFVLNPYDPCVANCIIDGKQCTIGWYVDDTKISHVDPDVVTGVLQSIESRFGKMVVTRGKKHVFLGMDIEFNDDGTFTTTMVDYIKEAIEEFGEDVTSSSAATPGGKSLYTVTESSPVLARDKADTFHKIVAKLLYISSRARSDILPTIAFLCTRVSSPTVQDWSKLKRLLRYLNDTLALSATLGADGMTKMMTWVDAAYAVHPDMKSHTGGCVSMGRGVFMPKSTKQKLNTKSSTEAELVGASDYLPNTIWARNFLEGQGYDIVENVFYQDNQSAIRLEKNGRASAGQKSRHINIRYFFIKDRISDGDLEVVYCPTELMLADFYTKPLQGSLFRKFRSVILGYEHVSILEYDASMLIEERVGERHLEDRPLIDDVSESDESRSAMINQLGSSSEWTLVTRRKTPGSRKTVEGPTVDNGDPTSGKMHEERAEGKSVKHSRKYETEKSGEDASSPHTLKIIPS